MDYTTDQLLQAISKYNDMMVESTMNAETKCSALSLKLYGDGSSAINYEWISNTPQAKDMTARQRGDVNLVKTFSIDRETTQIFDSLGELYQFLRDKNVL